eukprot:jgi/Galph1/971/GphlegSOOS_G5695.1
MSSPRENAPSQENYMEEESVSDLERVDNFMLSDGPSFPPHREETVTQDDLEESDSEQSSHNSEENEEYSSYEFADRISLRSLLTLVTNNNPNVLRAFFRGESPQSNEELISYLKRIKSIKSKRVEEAFRILPRDIFVPEDQKGQAFENYPLRVEELGYNISAPEMYAIALEHLSLKAGDRVLDIGCGSGHLTCMLAYMVGSTGFVRGIDLSSEIVDTCRKNIEMARFSRREFAEQAADIEIVVANVFFLEKASDEVLYDAIYCGATCPLSHLKEIVQLLRCGGILVCPIGNKLYVVKREESENSCLSYCKEAIADVRFGNLIVPSKYDILREKYKKRFTSKMHLQKVGSSMMSDFGSYMKGVKECERIPSLLMSAEESDITLVAFDDSKAQDEYIEIPAHKVVLAARSGHFRALFQAQMKDSGNRLVYIPPEFPFSVFYECLKYIYTDKATINEHNCVEVLECARFYDIPDGLCFLCEEQLKNRALSDPNEVAQVLVIAHRYACKDLKTNLANYILRNFETIKKTETWKELDPELVDFVLEEAYDLYSFVNSLLDT